MDDPDRRPYVGIAHWAIHLELLLLLSAFLTALTGAVTGVRPAQGVAAQEQVVVAASTRQVRPLVAPRALFPRAAYAVGERIIAALPMLTLAVEPHPFGQRRRE